MRNLITAQAPNKLHRHIRVHGRFHVRAKKDRISGCYKAPDERGTPFNRCDRGLHLQHGPICAGPDDGQAIRLRKPLDRLIIARRWSKCRRKARGVKKLVIGGTGGIVKALQKAGQRRPIPQRQTKSQANGVGRSQPPARAGQGGGGRDCRARSAPRRRVPEHRRAQLSPPTGGS